MSKRTDIIGKRFGFLVVLDDSGQRRFGVVVWRCQCDCGNEHLATTGSLLNGDVKSCGCLRQDYYDSMHQSKRLAKFTQGIAKRYDGTNPTKLNTKKYANNTSGHRNIHIVETKTGRRYRVLVRFRNKSHHGGYFDDEETALKKRNDMREALWTDALDRYDEECRQKADQSE